jgi:hypothetical protein
MAIVVKQGNVSYHLPKPPVLWQKQLNFLLWHDFPNFSPQMYSALIFHPSHLLLCIHWPVFLTSFRLLIQGYCQHPNHPILISPFPAVQNLSETWAFRNLPTSKALHGRDELTLRSGWVTSGWPPPPASWNLTPFSACLQSPLRTSLRAHLLVLPVN